MTNKTLTCTVLLFFVLGAATASAADRTALPTDPVDSQWTGSEQVGDHVLLATSGGKPSLGCLGTIAGVAVTGLVVGALTGGVGLALVGAYAPIAVVLCS